MPATSLNILLVNASGRRKDSISRKLVADFTQSLKGAGRKLSIVERDLTDGVPHVDEGWIAANFTPPDKRTAEQAAILSYSDGLVDELKAADLIIIGAPVYNFGVPAALKAWIDMIARARVTFKYTEDGPVGLLENKRAIIVAASGGTKIGSPIDFATPYLRHVLGFIGVKDVDIIAADQLILDAGTSLAKAQGQINATMRNIVGAERKAA